MDESVQSTVKSPEFGKFRSVLWPIHGYEMKKFLPMSLLMFCILYVYTMVRDLKDVFITKCAICGRGETLSTLKLWFVLPAAFLVVMLFTFLVNKFGSYKTFYIMVSMFLGFYSVFLLVLFPNQSIIHANEQQVRALQASWPGMFYDMVPCLTNWSFTLFYIVSEIWGTIAIASLFWQFANQVTKKDEVKRFYGLYALIANVGVFLSGDMLERMSKCGGQEFNHNVQILIGSCVLFGIAAMGIFYYINKVVLKDPKFYDPSEVKVSKKKGKVGVMEGIKILVTSPYIGLIAVLVLGYGLSIGLTEIVWKKHMSVTLANPNDYASMMGNLSKTTGIATIIITILSATVLRKFSWRKAALITPIIMCTLGGVFFALIVYYRSGGSHLWGYSVPVLGVWLGMVVDALIKSSKYGLFDTTKNMAYRPLDADTRTKGQAAVEVIGGRVGKAGASFTTWLLTNVISVGSSIFSHLYVLIPVFAVTVVGWIMAVFGLSKQYENKVKENLAK